MRTLLIYLPGRQGASPSLLAAAGLGELLDGGAAPSFLSLDAPRGPDGAGGVVAYWGAGLPDVAEYVFAPGKGAARDKFWLGKPKEGRLAPEALARDKRQLGADVRLADGQIWHVPVARQLPQLLGLDDDGRWTGIVVEQYRTFYEDAWRALDWLAPDEQGVVRVDPQLAADFASRALSINYRVNRDVAAFLGLLTSDAIFDVAWAVVEYSALAAQKKTAAADATPTSPAGGPA